MDGENGEESSGLADALIHGGNAQVAYLTEGGGDLDDGDEDRSEEPLREQDRFLPIANVARIMKKGIPKSGKIAKDAKECVQECVSEFVSFITSEASERCQQEKRKTINGEDILFAMSTLGFDNYVEPLKVYLQKYRESTKGEKGMGMQDSMLDEMAVTDEAFGAALTSNILTEQGGNIVYTSAYPTSLPPQQLSFN